MGLTIAFFQRVGKKLVTKEALMISAKISAVYSILILIKNALMSSTPQAFVFIDLTTLVTSRPVISEKLNCALVALGLFLIFSSSSIILPTSMSALLLERKA